MRAASRRPKGPYLLHGFLALTLVLPSVAGAFDFGKADDAYGFCETFDIAREPKPLPCRLRLIESSAAGNVFHRDDTTVFTFQTEDLTDEPFRATGKVDGVRAGGPGRPGEMQVPGSGRKHFWLRQRPQPEEGLVKAGGLAIEHEDDTRIVEAALPWPQSPHVKNRWDAGDGAKFSSCVNHNARGPTVALARNHSAPQSTGRACHPDAVNQPESASEG